MTKIKISFEVTDVWDRDEFRRLIKLILFDPVTVCEGSESDFELYIISNDDSTTYIQSVGTTLGLDSQHIIVTNFRQDKVDAIENNGIDIHFDSDQLTIAMIEELDTQGVLVRSVLDGFNVRMKYITEFYNILKNVISEENETPEC